MSLDLIMQVLDSNKSIDKEFGIFLAICSKAFPNKL
jgi:hypothetical protein